MIAQEQDMEVALEAFAQEAADKIAQLWIKRGNAPLGVDHEQGLVDSIWECLLPGVHSGTDHEARMRMHSI